jgi:hypothetical protein
MERVPVYPSVFHEFRKCFICDDRDVMIEQPVYLNVDACFVQSVVKRSDVLFSGNDDDAITDQKASTYESAQTVEQNTLAIIKLHDVLKGSDLPGLRSANWGMCGVQGHR